MLYVTNKPWEMDEAAFSRFDRRLLVPLPNFQDRKEMIGDKISECSKLTDIEINTIANLTKGLCLFLILVQLALILKKLSEMQK